MKLFIRLIIIMSLLSFFTGCGENTGPDETSVDKMIEGIKADSVVILDVRTKEELTGPLGKMDGVIHIPLYELDKRAGELKKYKDKQIDVICRSGNRSRTAVKILEDKGYKAKSVKGGMRKYRKEGY